MSTQYTYIRWELCTTDCNRAHMFYRSFHLEKTRNSQYIFSREPARTSSWSSITVCLNVKYLFYYTLPFYITVWLNMNNTSYYTLVLPLRYRCRCRGNWWNIHFRLPKCSERSPEFKNYFYCAVTNRMGDEQTHSFQNKEHAEFYYYDHVVMDSQQKRTQCNYMYAYLIFDWTRNIAFL